MKTMLRTSSYCQLFHEGLEFQCDFMRITKRKSQQLMNAEQLVVKTKSLTRSTFHISIVLAMLLKEQVQQGAALVLTITLRQTLRI